MGVQARRRALLHELLVAALDGALALAEGDHVAVGVGEDLDLDVVGRGDELLHVALAVAEGRLGLGVGLGEGLAGVGGVLDLADAAAAAARARLDEHGAADALRLADRLVRVLEQVAARNDGHVRLAGGAARVVLVAHAVDDVRIGTDEHEAALLALAREVRVLREEPVAGVDGLGAGLQGDREDGVLVEVAVRRARPADAVGLVGEGDVQRLGIGRGVHGNGLDAHLLAGANHADRDLAAVRNEDLVEHRRLLAHRAKGTVTFARRSLRMPSTVQK